MNALSLLPTPRQINFDDSAYRPTSGRRIVLQTTNGDVQLLRAGG